MHFRIRKNVVQLVRTTYNSETKKPKAEVVGRIPLNEPAITDELRKKLSAAEAAEAEFWITNQHRMTSIREELAALTLGETLNMANRWLTRQGDTETASAAAAAFLPELQALRRTLKAQDLLG